MPLRVVKITLRILVIAILTLSLSTVSFAQAPGAPPAGADGESKSKPIGPRRQLATIIFAGLGGAVLGLSTLSFYGRPQDKLSNIAIGFAFGVIAGTIYVTYKAASQPKEFYGNMGLNDITPNTRDYYDELRIEQPKLLTFTKTF